MNHNRLHPCRHGRPTGSVLVLVVVSLVALMALGLGLLSVAYGVRHKALRLKNEVVAMLAAEAGYEKAIYWMGQQKDMLSTLANDLPGITGSLSFPDATCKYRIQLYSFVGSRPVYRIVSVGQSGTFRRIVDVLVIQGISGWDMGMCRVPLGANKTVPVYFAANEIIDIPLHINSYDDNPDRRDIYINGNPRFLQTVAVGESRYTKGGFDKYSGVLHLFEGGIYFDQPDSKVTDTQTIQLKLDRFRKSTKPQFVLKPKATAAAMVPNVLPAVQLEFFVEGGVGKVCITNNCTIRGYKRNSDYKTLDFKISDGSNAYERYDIYAYHYIPKNAAKKGLQVTIPLQKTYVTQSFGDVESEPGGQIFVDGNVVIGGNRTLHDGDQLIKGRVTVVATGNIWIADAIRLSGKHQSPTAGRIYGRPTMDNPNVLGLIAQGVIKVVDPGMSEYDAGGINDYPGPPKKIKGFEYVPVGRADSVKKASSKENGGYAPSFYKRHLPDPMIVEAALTVGGGGWGAENVSWKGYGGRKEYHGKQDKLVVCGAITEAIRGVVGLIGQDGYLKYYYMDPRLLEGILPGDIWLRGKFIPAPAGWHDYRAQK